MATTELPTWDLRHAALRIVPDVVVVPQSSGARDVVHLELSREGKFFRIGFREYRFLSLLDGQTSFATALALAAQADPAQALTEREAEELVRSLATQGLLAVHQPGQAPLLARRGPQGQDMGLPNLFWLRLPFGSPDRWLRGITPFFSWLFSPGALFALMIAIVWAVGWVLREWDVLVQALQPLALPQHWHGLLIAWVGLKLAHELGHGVASHRYGVRVRDSGILFLLGAPLAYVDVTHAWSLSCPRKRMVIAAAGMVVELWLAIGALLLWQWVHEPVWRFYLLNVVVMASVSTVLFNANPLMRFDGYYLLSDGVGIPNLYREGAEVVRQAGDACFWGRVGEGGVHYAGWRRVFIVAYGWAAWVWKGVVCVGLIAAASTLWAGAGMVVAGLGTLLWFVRPVTAWLQRLGREYIECRRAFYRCAAVLSLGLVVVVSTWELLPCPAPLSVPGVVEDSDSQTVRAPSEGWVIDVCVEEGAEVAAGDALLRLRNYERRVEWEEVQHRVAASLAKIDIARDAHLPGEVALERERLRRLRERLRLLGDEQRSLVIRAPTAGVVVARRLRDRLGTRVDAGEELLRIISSDAKELILAIADDDVDEVVRHVGRPLRIRIGSRPVIQGVLERVDPRGSHRLPHPSFSAEAGGPLAMQPGPSSDDDTAPRMQLCEPHFKAIVSLEPAAAAALFSGERACAQFGTRSERLGSWIHRSLEDWWARQRSAADSGLSHQETQGRAATL